MGDEEARNIAAEDDNLGLVVDVESLNQVGHLILGVLAPEVDERGIRVVDEAR
jgi:hypothetical protein